MDLVVVGSKPTRHPLIILNAPVAQLDRATDFESVGCTFDPCRAHFEVGFPTSFLFLAVKNVLKQNLKIYFLSLASTLEIVV